MLNLELAFSVAHSRFGVPSVLQPHDMLGDAGPDKLAVFGYLSSLYQAMHELKPLGKPPKKSATAAANGGKYVSPTSPAKKLASMLSPRRLTIRRGTPSSSSHATTTTTTTTSSLPSSVNKNNNNVSVLPRPSPAAPVPSIVGTPSAATSGKIALLRWCQKRAANTYPAAYIKDFRNCWQNGLALCAIAHSYFPNEVPFASLSTESEEDRLKNVNIAFEVMERCGGVPRLLDAEDVALVKEVEPQSLMTYLSTARRVLDSDSSNPLRSPPPKVSPTSRKLVFQPDVVVFPTPAVTPTKTTTATTVTTPQQKPAVTVATPQSAKQPTPGLAAVLTPQRPLSLAADEEEDEEEEDEDPPTTPVTSVKKVAPTSARVAPANTPARGSVVVAVATPIATPSVVASTSARKTSGNVPSAVKRTSGGSAKRSSNGSSKKRSLELPTAKSPAVSTPAVTTSTPAPAAVANLSTLKRRGRAVNLGLQDSEDASRLAHLNVESMCDFLKSRYAKDLIYTWCGDILISVNPYRALPAAYSLDQVKMHMSTPQDARASPHIYAIGRTALLGLASKNQSIVISGESGAGKTEATKLLVSFLASGSAPAGLQHRLFASGVLLEALGNAKTARNDNSSRFGKLFKLSFGADGKQLVGASVEAYLLEMSRVTVQAAGERNFHIFYHMCAGASTEERNLYRSQPASHFQILKSCTSVPSINDAKEWIRFKDALGALNFPNDVQQDMFRILSAILHLGNINFVESRESHDVEIARDGDASLHHAAELLGLQPGILSGSLTRRIIKASARDSIVHKSLSLSQAKEGRDTLCRVLYSKIFQLVLDRINAELAPAGAQKKDWDSAHKFIGLLDLFGFENFDSGNHFEQMMVNYANERMQQEFLRQVLRQDMDDYAKEGIPFPAAIPDNSACIELFEHRTRGIIAILDDECKVEDASAQSFVAKLSKEWNHSPHLSVPKLMSNKPSFTVNHYAESVTYSTHGFRSRNQHILRDDLMEAVAMGGRPLLGKFFQSELQGERGGRAGKTTVGRLFRSSLQELSAMLSTTHVSWIRCIKPNQKQKAQAFDDSFVTRQLTYLGMLSVAQLRQNGYPVRIGFKEFVVRYSACVGRNPNADGDFRKAGGNLLEEMVRVTSCKTTKGGKKTYQLGKTRIFLSSELFEGCEDFKDEQEAIAARKKKEEEERLKREEEERQRRLKREEEERQARLKREQELAAAEEKKKQMMMRDKGKEEASEPSPKQRRVVLTSSPRTPTRNDAPLLFLPQQSKPQPAAVAPAVVMLQNMAANLQGALQGAFSILSTYCADNVSWCEDVLKGTQGNGALSAMKFGKYPDVLSPQSVKRRMDDDPESVAKRSLRRKRESALEKELESIRKEKHTLEQEIATLRGTKSQKSSDRKMLEQELELAKKELTAIKRGLVEDALRRRAGLTKRQKTPPTSPSAAAEVVSTPMSPSKHQRASPPKGRRPPNRRGGVISPSKDICHFCHATTGDEDLRFGRVVYHPECFKCFECSKALPSNRDGVCEIKGQPHCQDCGKQFDSSKKVVSEQERLDNRLAELLRREEELQKKEQMYKEKEAREKAIQEERLKNRAALLESRADKEKKWAAKQQEFFAGKVVEEQKRRDSMVREIQELHAAEQEIQGQMSAVKQKPVQNLYGMDAELHEKVQSKYTDKDWLDAVTWATQVTGKRVLLPDDCTAEEKFWSAFRSGTLLCSLINVLFPGTLAKTNNHEGVALAEREDIQLYINACLTVGVPSHETFSVSDLYDKKFLPAVLTNLHSLCRVKQAKGNWKGPILGVKVTSYNSSILAEGKVNSPKWGVASNANYRRGRP